MAKSPQCLAAEASAKQALDDYRALNDMIAQLSGTISTLAGVDRFPGQSDIIRALDDARTQLGQRAREAFRHWIEEAAKRDRICG
jgi:hypothetical protein